MALDFYIIWLCTAFEFSIFLFLPFDCIWHLPVCQMDASVQKQPMKEQKCRKKKNQINIKASAGKLYYFSSYTHMQLNLFYFRLFIFSNIVNELIRKSAFIKSELKIK
jgi:hypothetical protein